jgi:tRNA G10  N-methylase Trm11
MRYLFVLGREAAISAAECWHVLTAQGFAPHLVCASEEFMVVDLDKPLPVDFLKLLGGCGRIAEVTREQDRPWDAQSAFKSLSPTSSRWQMGISVLGESISARWLEEFARSFKKLAQSRGKNLRFILPFRGKKQLNAAQVLFNKLTHEPHFELLLARQNDRFFLATTIAAQDIQAYALRDQARPARDAKAGMLPPKLAQMMVNLAAYDAPRSARFVLDPFCGTGTILQEGWLLGHQMMGSDSEEKMVRISEKNLNWLAEHFSVDKSIRPKTFHHDATAPFPAIPPGSIRAVATEPYLGHGLNAPLPFSQLESVMAPLRELYAATFRSLHPLLPEGGNVLFILPFFRVRNRDFVFAFMPQHFLDQIRAIGYGAHELLPKHLAPYFEVNERANLTYTRPGQYVGRELTFWKKIS